MVKNSSIVASLIWIIIGLTGCEDMEQTEVSAQQTSQALWSYPDQGEILYGETVKADLTWGDFGHRYAFEGIAGETVTFVVEWHEPESLGFGAKLSVQDASYNTIAQGSAWTDTKTHVEVTFTEDGVYTIYVGHNFWGWFGRYPYEFGADPHLCAQLSMVSSMPEWEGMEFYAVENYEVGQDGDPWSYVPEMNEESAATFTVIERDVKLHPCNAHVDGPCTASDPQICGGNMIGGGFYENKCVFSNELHTQASDFSAAMGGFTYDLAYCEE